MDHLLQPDPDHVLAVSDLTRQIKTLLEGRFEQLWVRGEISNLRRQSSGHVYFSLKDANSQLPCVLFARDAARQSFQLADGMEVLLFGALSVYEPHGRYQLIAKIAIESGEGRLQLQYERMKRLLANEGLFDTERKQPMPALPQRIAVITSPTGAAVRDFLRILQRRDFRGEVTVLPARVQGQQAAGEIVQMLTAAAASQPSYELVILTRGGGSIEDLWPFNEEAVARAVAACPIPVISAVGHEIDTVLSDFAADKRAETPSGAAELISTQQLASRERLQQAAANLTEGVRRQWIDQQRHLADLQTRMRILAPARQVELAGMRLDDLETRLCAALKAYLAAQQAALMSLAGRLQTRHPRIRLHLAQQAIQAAADRVGLATKISLRQQRERLRHSAQRLESSSLSATLKRGYAILQQTDGRLLTSAQATRASNMVTAQFHDGAVTLEVKK